MTTTPAHVTSGPTARPRVLRRAMRVGVLAAAGSAAAAIIVAVVAKAVGVQHASQLQPGPLAALSVLGVLVGTAAWVVICRTASEPARLLQRLVPAVLVLSFVPDVLVGLGADSWGDAVSLAFAHISVFAVTIPLLRWRLAPPSLAD